MDIISLPDDLKLKDSFPVQLFDYQISSACLKNKINLTKNTISFLLEGTKEVLTDHDPISIQNSEFLIMQSGHCLMTENLSSTNKIYRSILLFFSDDLLFDFIEKYNVTDKKSNSSKSIQVCSYDRFITSFVQSLEDIKGLNIKAQQKLLQVKFEEIMLYLTETKGADFLLFLTTNTDQHSRNLIKVVESNKLNKLTLKELAFLSNMSISTFKREFEKHFQEPPIKWFQDKRLEHSAFLLKEKSKRPSEIFEEAGYESLSNFIQAFKTKFKVTPKQYQLNN